MTALAEAAMLAYGWRRVLLLVVAGAVAALSVPPLFLLPALFVGLPVLVWSLDGAERGRGLGLVFGPAFRIGFCFGLGYFCVALHWIGAAFLLEGGVYVLLMPLALAGLAALLALFWGLGTALAHLLWSSGALRIVALATALTIAELARGHLFSGFPFDLLGYALTANDEMAQLASVVGVYGLTLLVALLAATPALIWPADDRGLVLRLLPFFVALLAIAAQLGYGNYRLATTPVTERADMRVRLVQPMIADHVDWTAADPAQVMDRLLALSETRLTPSDPGLVGVTHLIWPESVFPFFLSDYPEALARIARMLPPSTLLLTGAPRAAIGAGGLPEPEHPGFNAILAIDSAGEVVGSYDKTHLVPFGEYLPFPDFFALFGVRQFVPGTNGWVAGSGRRLLQVPATPPFLALICYEAVFPGAIGAVAEAEFILNITNDAWFDGSIGPAQHAHHARMRSVETGLPMLRAANSGITMVVDPLGRVTARLAAGEIGLLDAVPANRLTAATPFDRFGHMPLFVALGLGALVSVAAARRRRRA